MNIFSDKKISFFNKEERKCVDCKWCHIDGLYSFDFFCHCPKNIDKNRELVTGKTEHNSWRYRFCTIHREDGFIGSFFASTCGKHGRWFEPKEKE